MNNQAGPMWEPGEQSPGATRQDNKRLLGEASRIYASTRPRRQVRVQACFAPPNRYDFSGASGSEHTAAASARASLDLARTLQ